MPLIAVLCGAGGPAGEALARIVAPCTAQWSAGAPAGEGTREEPLARNRRRGRRRSTEPARSSRTGSANRLHIHQLLLVMLDVSRAEKHRLRQGG